MARLLFKYIFIFLLFSHINILLAQSSSTYTELITSADNYFSKKDYYNAKTTYQLALQLDKNAEYPKKKIEEIIQILNNELELRIIFEEKMQYAEEAYVDKDYQKAIELYKEASALIDYEDKPKQEIIRIKKEWADLINKQSKFDLLFAEAQEDKQLEDFVSAILKLEEADKLFPGKLEVTTELALLNVLFKQQNAKIQEFRRLMSDADLYMEQNRFQIALKNYQEAANLFENDSQVQNQLMLVKDAIKINDAYNLAIEKADAHYIALELDDAKKAYLEAAKIWPEKTYPGNMLAKLNEANKRIADDLERFNSEYDSKIYLADQQFKNQMYKQAFDMYTKAIDLKPDEEYPQNQIHTINAILKKNKEYNNLIENGDLKLSQGKLNDALFDYYKAKNLKPGEKYPQEKIAQIDEVLYSKNAEEKNYQNQLKIADSLFDNKLWESAISQYIKVIALKENEEHPKKRLSEAKLLLSDQNKLNASYQSAIQIADDYFDRQLFSEARKAYLNANRIKPDEQYPLYKIEDINTIVEQKGIRERNNRYRELVASADKLFEEKAYTISLTQYKQANVLKPNEVYPPQQIAKIDQILSTQNELDNIYSQFIKSADSTFYLNELISAREIYVQANEVKPKKEYPIEQINKIDHLLSDLNDIEQNYILAIERADASFANIKYESAKKHYSLALTYKPDEAYPKLKIEEMDALLAEISFMEAAYQNAILKGDQNFEVEQYLLSIDNYREALGIKENEEYPKTRIAAIELILDNLDQIEMLYNLALTDADNFFRKYKYTNALTFYEKAKSLKPQEAYPQDQIAKIKNILAALDLEYKGFIKQGDDAYRLVIFQDAIVAYENAIGVFPDEAYPKMMLDKIDERIRRESVVILVATPEIIEAGKEKRYVFKPIDYRDRQNNYILIEMKNAAVEPIRAFINFGQDSMKNGGYSVTLLQRDGYTKYFVRIDKHMRWQSKDNNWISLLPEGGDLDVKFIQISRDEKSN
ncbi:MAG: hypothetical protein PF484_00870 [Bacteroidales bacterium]|jgi:tetratricopeptide (TPR) repeat protein|nr:hypothetical protein [Bacteroidales bacterium]